MTFNNNNELITETNKFKIKNIYLVGKISEELTTETHCSICRNHLEENSIYIENNTKLFFSKNSVEKGQCNHIFHCECIRRWLITNVRCPNCFKKWQSK